VSRKSGFVTNLGRSKLCAAVGVDIAAVLRLARTSQRKYLLISNITREAIFSVLEFVALCYTERRT